MNSVTFTCIKSRVKQFGWQQQQKAKQVQLPDTDRSSVSCRTQNLSVTQLFFNSESLFFTENALHNLKPAAVPMLPRFKLEDRKPGKRNILLQTDVSLFYSWDAPRRVIERYVVYYCNCYSDSRVQTSKRQIIQLQNEYLDKNAPLLFSGWGGAQSKLECEIPELKLNRKNSTCLDGHGALEIVCLPTV